MHMLFFIVVEISMMRGSRSTCKSGNILRFCVGTIGWQRSSLRLGASPAEGAAPGGPLMWLGSRLGSALLTLRQTTSFPRVIQRPSKGSIWKRNAASSMTQTALLRPLILLLFFLLDGETNVSELQPPGNARSKSQQPLCFSPSPANAFRSQNGK